MKRQQRTPYQEGYGARLRGDSLQANPFDCFAASENYKEWREGWRMAEKTVNPTRDKTLGATEEA